MPDANGWNRAAANFVDHYSSLYGRVRIEVVDAHLRDHLPSPPASVVDVGGGSGHQSLALVRRGYRLTLVDPSAAMLEEAELLLATELPELRRNVTLLEASLATVADRVDVGSFAGVLCHGVLPFMDDPLPAVSTLRDLAMPGGTISIIAKNRRAQAMRLALARDWAAALHAFDATVQTNSLGLASRGDTVEDLTRILVLLGLEVDAWYGVRLFTETWGEDYPAQSLTPEILAVELQASRRDPYRQVSHLFHLIGRRPD